MTLLAAFPAFKIPFIVGDFVISQNLKPVGLRKKVHRISANCGIGWTGNLTVAMRVLGELFGEFSEAEVTVARLEKFLQLFDKDEFGNDDVTLVGWVIEKEASCFRWNSRYPDKISYSSAVFDGSARTVAEEYFGAPHGISNSDRPDEINHTKAVATVLNMVAHLTANAMLGKLDPKLAFGHAFEILYFDSQKGFHYLDNILYLLLDIIIDENYGYLHHNLSTPIYKYRAFGNYSLTEIYYSDKKHVDFFIISPVGDDDRQLKTAIKELANPKLYVYPFESSFYCFLTRYLSHTYEVARIGVITKHNTNNPDSWVRIDKSGALEFTFVKEQFMAFLDEILKDQAK